MDRGRRSVYRAWRRLRGADRLLALGLLLFLGLGTYFAWKADPGLPADDLCTIFHRRPAWFVEARAAEKRWATPIALQMAIIRHESGFRARIRPPRRNILWIFPGPRPSSAFGYSQALDGTWRDYQRQRDRPSARRDRFADAVDFVAWYSHRLSRETGVPPDDSYRLYLAYHQGPAGFLAGSYQGRPSVLKHAERVASTAGIYGRQLTKCRPKLEWRQRAFFAFEMLLLALLGGLIFRSARRKLGSRA